MQAAQDATTAHADGAPAPEPDAPVPGEQPMIVVRHGIIEVRGGTTAGEPISS